MSFVSLVQRTALQRTCSLCSARGYSSKPSSSSPGKTGPSEPAVSSCPAGTVMTGLNYLKGEPPVLAKPDDEYPAWLWNLPTTPRRAGEVEEPRAEEDGAGGKAEKRRLRLQHRQTLKDRNLFKAK